MKRFFSIAFLLTLFFVSCKKIGEDNIEQPTQQPALISAEKIDEQIRNTIRSMGAFDWSSASTEMLWSALQHRDQLLSVGYKPATAIHVDESLHEINIHTSDWKAAKTLLLQQIIASEQQLNKNITINDMALYEDEVLPVFNIVVKNMATIKMLRNSGLVRYAEPMAYEPTTDIVSAESSSGCGSNTAQSGLVAGVDYTTIAPNSKQSWNYAYHKIPNAWAKSTGGGIKIFIIDSGSEFDQDNLGSAFNQGYSSGRTIERIVTLPRSTFLGIPTGPVETADDACGHGTSMAGAAAAPRGIDGAAVGVAYNSNLVTCRAAEDVLIDASREVTGVTNAFTNAGNRADVRIISMSMGRLTSSSQISDAVRYANGKGKLIFCAAGTSFGWTSGWYGVIFPATMSEVSAVTGVRDNNFNDQCSACHDGSDTDFTIVMEKASNERHPLTLAMSGNVPSTVGGSSVSTATAAGIAALVWSRFPSYNKTQVLNKLITTSANYPARNGSFGWGNINADAATN
jgi:hypothetical protein